MKHNLNEILDDNDFSEVEWSYKNSYGMIYRFVEKNKTKYAISLVIHEYMDIIKSITSFKEILDHFDIDTKQSKFEEDHGILVWFVEYKKLNEIYNFINS